MGLLMRFWKPICRKLGLGERTFHTKYPIMIAVPLCTIGIALGKFTSLIENPRTKRLLQSVQTSTSSSIPDAAPLLPLL